MIADVGSGTGISARLFVQNGNTVFGVEPNDEMRRAAEVQYGRHPNFRSVAATAECTSLPAQSVDYVVAGQAFHWFDREQARREFARISRPGGWVVLLWNVRRTDSTDFLRAYEALLLRYGTDYEQVCHRKVDDPLLKSFFTDGLFTKRCFDNQQLFDFDGLKGRTLSASYVPSPGHADFEPMLGALGDLYQRFETDGQVRLEYDTEVYFGRVEQ